MCKDLVSQKLSTAAAAVQSAMLALLRGQLTRAWTRRLASVTSGASALPQTVQPSAVQTGTRIRGRLVSERALCVLPIGALLLALLVASPTLRTGWRDDDLLQRLTLSASSLTAAMRRLYVFLDPATNAARMDSGVLPWWTLETSKVAFWRPLAAISLWLDYRLWPESGLWMHAHNALWYAVACAMAAVAYLRCAGRTRSAGLAALLFTVSVTHINCVAPLASRNILLCASFGFLTVVLHGRWRGDRCWANGVPALLSLALTLLSSEAGIAVGAYLVAYATCLDRGTLRQRLGSLVPYGGIVLSWLATYRWLGYGAHGSAFYVDPISEPLSFARAALENAPVLLFGQWVMPDPAVYAILSPGSRTMLWSLAVLTLGFLAWLLLPLLRQDAVARFFLVGMLLSLPPACAVGLPSGRHLMFVGFGALGLLARFAVQQLGHRAETRSPGRRSSVARATTVALLGLHAFLYPVIFPLAQRSFASLSVALTDLALVRGDMPGTVTIINMPSPGHLIYTPALRQMQGRPMPAHLRVLAPGHSAVLVERLDPYTLAVRPEHGYLLRPGSFQGTMADWLPLTHPSYATRYGDGLVRSPGFPIAEGHVTELTRMRVEVTQLTEDGRPLEATMRFDVPLEHSSLLWLQWDWTRAAYRPFVPPPQGTQERIPGPI